MAAMNQLNRLSEACKCSEQYPANIWRTRCPGYMLESYRRRLEKESDRLFERDADVVNPIDILDATNDSDFQHSECTSTEEIRDCCAFGGSHDTDCRLVFIQADNSFAPLDCSRLMCALLLTFHQVMPQFLDHVLSFGEQPDKRADFYTAFHHDIFLNSKEAEGFKIQELGRSGRQVRHCYNLWSVEKSDAKVDRPRDWNFRQTAVYHSLDLEYGKAFWIHIKANGLMLDRVKDVARATPRSAQGTPQDEKLAISFIASLRIHLVSIIWCAENWRDFLCVVDREIEMILKKVNNAPIGDIEKKLQVDTAALIAPLRTTGTFPRSSVSRAGSFQPQRPARHPSGSSRARGALGMNDRVLSGLSGTGTAQSPTSPLAQPNGLANGPEDEGFNTLNEFNFNTMQRLHGIGKKVQQARLIMGLNSKILGSVADHYKSLWEDVNFPMSIKNHDGCKAEMSIFQQDIQGCRKLLEIEVSRIESLMTLLEDGKRGVSIVWENDQHDRQFGDANADFALVPLPPETPNKFDAIMQFRNMEINKLFAANAQKSADRMEQMTADMHNSTLEMEKMTKGMWKVAEKTERQTSLMHIITVVTLLFLPGTFVAVSSGLVPSPLSILMSKHTGGPASLTHASTTNTAPNSGQTLFGSGLYQWDENNPDQQFPTWKPEYFALFSKICFPLMAGTFIFWFAAYLWAKKRSRRVAEDEEKAAAATVGSAGAGLSNMGKVKGN